MFFFFLYLCEVWSNSFLFFSKVVGPNSSASTIVFHDSVVDNKNHFYYSIIFLMLIYFVFLCFIFISHFISEWIPSLKKLNTLTLGKVLSLLANSKVSLTIVLHVLFNKFPISVLILVVYEIFFVHSIDCGNKKLITLLSFF